MITLLSDDFQPLVVTQSDLVIASIAWGFTLGFGFLTTCKQRSNCCGKLF